jgi:uncharacterized lipoprotein YddW (UPF0748 family)
MSWSGDEEAGVAAAELAPLAARVAGAAALIWLALSLLAPGAGAAADLPAAATVRAGDGAQPARAGSWQGRPALELPCPFASARSDRCYWDIGVNWNLRTAPGIALRLLCTDTSPVSQFNVYLRAGGIWHAAKVSLTASGRWETLSVLKTDTSPEGVSRGWGQVDQVRVAAWRGSAKDTSLYLAGLERLSPNVAATLLRPSATVASAERATAQRYARNVASALASAGILPACVEDLDVAAAGFAGSRLVILPYHPDLPADLTRHLTEFVAGGGRVIGFYTLPAALGQAIGIGTGRYVKAADVPGGIAGIQFSSGSLRGLPSSLRQDSGNVLDLVPSGHGAQRLGWWTSNAGQRTDYTALAVSSRGAWLGHVYLARDATNGRRLLLALAGHFLPALWQHAADHQLHAVTEGISAMSFETAIRHLLAKAAGHAQSREALESAAALYRSAQAAYNTAHYPECVAEIDRCRDQLARGVMLLQPAPARELRGAWCHRGYGIAGLTWEQTAQQMAACGLNALFVNVANGGQADYPSNVLAVSPTCRDRGDQMRACLSACTPRGIQVHAWKVCFNLGQNPPPDIVASFRREGRLQRTADGSSRDWLCPSHPENRLLEARAAAELVARYRTLAGVHLDFIRFPGSDTCYCDTCRKGFEKALGRRLDGWPRAAGDKGPLASAWNDYRRQVITETVRRVAEAVRQVRPDAQVSAAVFSNWTSARESVAQDWGAWAKKGYVDFVCPMNYHGQAEAQRGDVLRQLAWLRGSGVEVYPGIGVSAAHLDAIETIRQINVTRAGPTGGFVLFELNRREAQDILPALAPALGR